MSLWNLLLTMCYIDVVVVVAVDMMAVVVAGADAAWKCTPQCAGLLLPPVVVAGVVVVVVVIIAVVAAAAADSERTGH